VLVRGIKTQQRQLLLLAKPFIIKVVHVVYVVGVSAVRIRKDAPNVVWRSIV
jgi:hypothetical protein